MPRMNSKVRIISTLFAKESLPNHFLENNKFGIFKPNVNWKR